MNDALRIPVEEMSQAGEARRLAVPLCRIMRFSEVDISRISLIVTETATNLAKHTAGGEILIRSLECAGTFGIEILETILKHRQTVRARDANGVRLPS